MFVLKRVYIEFVDLYPHIANIGYHNDIVNLVTCSPTPVEVKVNGKSSDVVTLNLLIEKIKLRFPHKDAEYVLEEV